MQKPIFCQALNGIENACIWGAPMHTEFIGRQVNAIPAETKGLFFYEGVNFDAAYLKEVLQQFAHQITHLTIGYCHHPKKDTHLRYHEILYVLDDFHFPKLQTLELGIDYLIANEHCVYGKLGNLTQLLQNAPKLEKLFLYGHFQLDKPLIFSYLKDLQIIMDDFCNWYEWGRNKPSDDCQFTVF